MTGASVNFKAVKSAGHAVSHASRKVAPTYLLPSDKSMGTVIVLDDEGKVSQVLDAKMALASPRAKVDQRYSPVWEGILNLRRPEPGEDSNKYRAECSSVVTDWYKQYETATGHKVLRVDVHLDEGHMVNGEAVLNAHAHIIADRTNDLGRVIKLSPKQLRELQTATAEITQLERGKSSFETGRKHISHQAYKHLAEQGRLETQQVKVKLDKSQSDLAKQRDLSKEWSDADLEKVKVLESKLDGEPARLDAALKAQEAQLREQYRLDREALKTGAEKAKQADYQALKKTHDAELSDLKTAHEQALVNAQTEAAKVPKLQKQIDQLTPEAAKVPGLEAQALELAQLKERITAAKARVAAKVEPLIDPRSRYHPDNIAKQGVQEAATAAARSTPRVMPKIEPKAVERVRPVAPQPKPEVPGERTWLAVPFQEREAAKALGAKWDKDAKCWFAPAGADLERLDKWVPKQPQQEVAQSVAIKQNPADLPLGDQGRFFDSTLVKSTQMRQEKLNRVSAKVSMRQERRKRALQAVFKSRPPEPTGMLAALKRGAYEKAMDALEPIYQQARKLAKQAEELTQKVSEAAKQAQSWAYIKLQKSDPGLVQRVEKHRYDERMETSRRQRVERDAQRALRGPGKGISR